VSARRPERPSSDAGPAPDGAHEDGASPDAEVDTSRRRFNAWLWRIPVLLAVGLGSWGMYEAIHTHFFKRRPDPTPDWIDGPPTPVAPLTRFGEVWASATFTYQGVPAVAVRLPGPIPGGLETGGVHLAAFSRVCTHLGCIVRLNRDAEAIAFAFNYRAPGPQLVCRCHLSVFDPVKSGRAVAGPAIEPLPRVRLARDGEQLIATGLEPAPPG
jgi:Rieske Fe-S protein